MGGGFLNVTLSAGRRLHFAPGDYWRGRIYFMTPALPRVCCRLVVNTPTVTPTVAVWRLDNVVRRINEVTQRRARLVLRWVT